MSDLTLLIQNLHKVIGEHSEQEKETEQVSHTAAEEVEVRNGENEIPQQTGEESRKRKRGVDEVSKE